MAIAPQVSIIIPHFNGKEILQRCLQSLRLGGYPAKEIILVDNGSTDDSIDMATRLYPECRVETSSSNLGFAGGCNLGMRVASGAYFVLLNNDAVVTPGWLEALVRTAQSQPDFAALQPKIRSLRNAQMFDYAGAGGGRIDILGYPFCRGRIFFTVEKDDGQYDDAIEVFWASGTCTLLRRSAIEVVGDFDEAFFAHMEEIDLDWRFHLAGFRVGYVPDAVVFHNAGSTLSQESPQKLFLNHRNSLMMLLKNYSFSSLLWVLPIRMLFDALAMINALVQGNLRHALAIVRAGMAVWSLARHIAQQRQRLRSIRKLTDREVRRKMYRRSIVLQYFAFGHKTYRELVDG